VSSSRGAVTYLGSQIGWGTRIGNLEMRLAFKPCLERLWSRPAAKRGREIVEALVSRSA
jgi:hypothetical protein